jgi:hypothetical protein
MEHDYANLRSSVARCQRLAMSPNTQHRIPLPRVELRDDDDLHGSSHAAVGGAELGGRDGGSFRAVCGGAEGFGRRNVPLRATCGVVES